MSLHHSSSRRTFSFVLVTLLFSAVFVFTAGEIITRFFWNKLHFNNDEKNLTYRYDKNLGWFPIEASTKKVDGSRTISVIHNKDGFRDVEHGEKKKKRIAFLGDSYTWGFDAEANERYTDRLQKLMPEWEILNMGVSGYGNDQQYILIKKWFDKYQPDIVVLTFCDNDWSENASNEAHCGYYKPYFTTNGNELVENGVPVPKSLNYYHVEFPTLFKSQLVQLLLSSYIQWKSPVIVFKENHTPLIIAAIKKYVETKGAKFKLAFVCNTDYEKKLAMCKETNMDYLFLGDNQMYTTCGWHWTPEGNDSVSVKMFRFLNL